MKNDKPKFVSLRKAKNPAKCDVVIIGGGMAGMLSAYMLGKAGKKVILIEKNVIASGMTAYTTAFITEVIDTSLSDLIKIWGPVNARDIVVSHQQAIDLFEDIVTVNRIDCSFKRCSNHEYANNPEEFELLREEVIASKKLGLNTKLHERMEADEGGINFPHYGYLEFLNQAKFDPFLFIYGLAKVLKNMGVKIYEHTEAKKIKSDRRLVAVETVKRKIIASHAIVATYKPFNEPAGLKFKTVEYKSYVSMFDVDRKKINIKEGIYEDIRDPYNYFRIDNENDVSTVLIGGGDHRVDLNLSEEKVFSALKKYTETIFPSDLRKNEKKWTGTIIEPVDGIAFIGPVEENNIFYATGFSGNGMTYSMISASIFDDLIAGRKNHWLHIYRADRAPTAKSLIIKGRDYIREFIHGAVSTALRGKIE